jgi:hypothetical protein
VDRLTINGTGFFFEGEGFVMLNLHIIQQPGQLSLIANEYSDGVQSFFFTQCRIDPSVASDSIIVYSGCCIGFLELPSFNFGGGTSGASGLHVYYGGVVCPFGGEGAAIDLTGTYVTVVGFSVGSFLPSLGLSQGTAADQGVQFWDMFFGPAISVVGGGGVQVGTALFGKSITPSLIFGPTIGVYVVTGTFVLENSLAFGNILVPSVVGTGGFLPGSNGTDTDFSVGGLLTGGGDPVARSWNESLGAYSAQIHCSWANLAAAQPGGFGGMATSVGNNAQIVTITS